jgi:thiol-disulfide isomerase/thioredoxin
MNLFQKSTFSVRFAGFALFILAFIGLSYYFLNYQKNDDLTSPTTAEKIQIEHFQLKTIDSKTVSLRQLAGSVTLMNFWATWCESCIIEMPSIVELEKKYHDRGLRVIAVNLDDNPQSPDIPEKIKELEMHFGTFFDIDQSLSQHFEFEAIPFTVVFSNDGTILDTHSGDRDWMDSDFTKKLEQWLKR